VSVLKIQFTIPMTQELMASEANLSEHWSVKSARHRKQKKRVAMYFLPHKNSVKLPVSIRMVRISPRTLDFDNLVYSFKWIRDKLADSLISGLAPGRADGDPRLTWDYAQEEGQPKEYAIRIELSDST
jgi:hypothetical protein